MKPDNTDVTLDFIIGYCSLLRNEVPAAKAELRLMMPDGLGASGSGTGPGRTSGHHSLVESAVLGRIPGNHTLRSLDDELDAAAKTLRHLLNDCRKIRKLGRTIIPIDGEPVRCDGGAGREGYLLPRSEGGWSFPDCDNIVKGTRTCDRCRQAASRWARTRDVTVSQSPACRDDEQLHQQR